MAATLALSLLGHVLFLKSQVPFPVAQLMRMPSGQSNSRAAKRRDDLVSAMDILSSHMHTTFTALSTALAQNKKRKNSPSGTDDLASAHLVFALGPSVGAARARVVYVVDGLEVKSWGERDHGLESSSQSGTESTSEDDTSEDSETEDDDETDLTSEPENEDGDGFDEVGSDSGTEPPQSRSPSPSTASSSRSPSPSPAEIPDVPVRSPLAPARPSPSDVRRSASPTSNVAVPTYAEEQQRLRAAERLLSRTLASACAEEGGGMSCELAPTQTHVLLRAPRRFAHPAWIPRQNLTRTLDGVLDAFMAESGCSRARTANKSKTSKANTRAEGVWIACRGSKGGADWCADVSEEGCEDDGEDGEDEEVEDEEDEMIWWVWDGKIVGFSDW
ncbi:hypothetical protein CERSUDRAFT_121676 [Gelatoporia subvermispora B]|uniref:Uncharacterized protein n=1 Tax=Ceriporiopsis subvermispora (strain B) TaxID=914234 RepID=M2R9M4_CERS8|nr:hypothetical protein CERSUDRAFT_121676 [Gelatoporia subvermispora B]